MADLTATELKQAIPPFADREDAEVNRAIELAYQLSDVSRDATLYCAAHLLAISGEDGDADGGSGEVEQEGLGPQAVRYKTQARRNPDVFFTRTAYGRLFLTMESRSPKAVISVWVG